MLKRSGIIAAILLSVLTTCWSAGFYIGAGFGPDMVNFSQKALIFAPYPASFYTRDNTHFYGTGVFASLFSGYAWTFNRFYLAAEANANISSVKFKSLNDEYVHLNFNSTRYKMPRSFGIGGVPGFLLSDTTLFYGRLGYVNGNFKITTTDNSLANVDKNLNGVRYGVGINQLITQRFSVRLEYSRSTFTAAHLHVLQGITTKNTSISPTSSLVEFGLVYNFA